MRAKFRYQVMIAALFLWGTVPVRAGGAGSTGAVFLKVPVGTRAIAMGETFTALADDASSVYWNPAGLSSLESREFMFMETFYLASINYHFIAIGSPLGRQHGVGLMANIFTMDPIEKWVEDPVTKKISQEGDFTVMLGNVAVGFSRRFSGRFRAGVAIKIIFQKIDEYPSTTFGADLGFIMKTGLSGFTVGGVIQNLGLPAKFKGTFPDPSDPSKEIPLGNGDPLPLTGKIGFGYQLSQGVIGLDITIPVDNKIRVSTGLEWWYTRYKVFQGAIRLGYKYQGAPDFNDLGTTLAGLSLGGGLRWNNENRGLQIRVDYAYQPFGDLGEVHRVGLTVGF